VWKKRLLIAGVFAALFLPVVAYVVTRPAQYEAELRLILKHQRTEQPVTGERGSANSPALEEMASAEIELLRGRELFERVALQNGLIAKTATEAEDRRARAEAVRQLDRNLKIAQVGKTPILSVKFTSGDPKLAAAVPNALADLYLEKHVEVHHSSETAAFFAEQTSLYRQQLQNAQAALERYRRTGDVSLIQDQKQASLRRSVEVEAQAQDVESQIRDARQRLALLRQQEQAQPKSIETGSRIARNTSLIERLKGQLIDLNNKRTELLTKYDPSYRLVKEVEQQMADLRAALDRENAPQLVDQTLAPNPLRQAIESEILRTDAQLAGLEARRGALHSQLGSYKGRQDQLEGLTANHNDLERAVRLAEENLVMYQRKLETARLEDALNRQRILNVAVLERAIAPVAAANSAAAYLILFAFFAAGALALAAAYLADYLERNLPSRQALVLAPEASELPASEKVASIASTPKYFQRRAYASGPEATALEATGTQG
jgi:uncharacterized protein involved in exopolysaccharide biosynthesis